MFLLCLCFLCYFMIKKIYILGTYVVMSSTFKTGQGVKLPMVGDFTYWAPLSSSVLFLVLGDDQVALGGRNGGRRI